MIELIQKLIDANKAYEKDGHVLFHVPSFENMEFYLKEIEMNK